MRFHSLHPAVGAPGQPCVLPEVPALPLAVGMLLRVGSVCHTGAGGLCVISAFCLLNALVKPVPVSERKVRLEGLGLGRGGEADPAIGRMGVLPCSFQTSTGVECDAVTSILGHSGPFPRSAWSLWLQTVASHFSLVRWTVAAGIAVRASWMSCGSGRDQAMYAVCIAGV